ncbi:MAG: 60S ribosomal export protein NMD3 [Desulfurococcales archaeon]|nr:60S ribosomal export protein NMD3 [Desulfurococcales archaeon]
MRICPRCGRSTNVVIRGLCPQCYAETYGIVRIPSEIEIEVCRYCGSIRLGRKWAPSGSFEESIQLIASHLLQNARKDPNFTGYRIEELRYETLPNWRTKIELIITAYHGDVRVRVVYPLVIRLKPSVCPVCKTRVSGEYDTLLQVRPRGSKTKGEELEDVILQEALRSGLGGQLVDIIRVGDGVDVYFTNAGAARKLARRLINMYGGSLSQPVYEYVTITSTGKRRARKTMVLRIGGDRPQGTRRS